MILEFDNNMKNLHYYYFPRPKSRKKEKNLPSHAHNPPKLSTQEIPCLVNIPIFTKM